MEAKWEKITEALEPFQLEPTTQYLVKRLETKELDLAIEDIEKQIEELEVNNYTRPDPNILYPCG